MIKHYIKYRKGLTIIQALTEPGYIKVYRKAKWWERLLRLFANYEDI